tara:strand:- start:2259 stop:2702 length:444 start_codon:yes stop_codon:yes gene_type:complete
MAYVITSKGNLFKIAANSQEKDDLNVYFPPAVAIDISDEDFLKVKKNIAYITISGDNATVVDHEPAPDIKSEEELQGHINTIKPIIESFLIAGSSPNSSKILWSIINNYNDILNNLNLSTITFPLNKSWEQHCEDNSIEYVNILQIP